MDVGKPDVKAGEYRFLIDGNHLTIKKGKRSLRKRKAAGKSAIPSHLIEVVSNGDGKMVELRFAGKKSVFVLAQ